MEPEGFWWSAVFSGMPVAESVLVGFCFSWLAKPFMENRKKAFVVGGTYTLAMAALYIALWPISGFGSYVAGILAAFLVMCRTDRRNFEQKAFISVTFFALRWFTSAMAEILYDKLYVFIERTAYMAVHPELDFALYAGVCIFYLASELLFTVAGIGCILKNYSYKRAGMSKGELLMLVVPSLMGVAGYVIIWCYRHFYISETGKIPDAYDALSFFYCAVAVVTIVVVIVLYQNIKAGQEEKLQKELLATQVSDIRQHIEQAESLYQEIRSIRHDMANHILTLERLYAKEEREEAKAYGAELKASLMGSTGEIRSGNPVTDVILQGLKSEAEKKKIYFQSQFYFPSGSGINAFDISVILNNALQNAMENTLQNTGEARAPYIAIRSYSRNNAYMIEVENSFAGKLRWDRESGLPVTSKDEKGGHGYGLANIRRMAGKYAGDMAIDIKEGIFCLSIMLMMETQ